MDLSERALDFAAVRAALARGVRAEALVAESCRRAQACAADGIFTALVPVPDVMARIAALQRRAAAGADLPLLGLTFSVKDNIHVAGMATTANCPALAIRPEESAACVDALESAGAVLIGKNTLDQFATGLNGTRGPEPLCRNARNPDYIPGGSSSGSAVAVARGLVSFALGSDTGGSGRVPAACNGIVGLKPTLGLVSTRGLVYNSRVFDCVPIFAARSDDAYEILRLIGGHDPRDPFSRIDADTLGRDRPPIRPARLAVPHPDQLRFFGDDRARACHAANLAILRRLGYDPVEIDFEPFAEAGRFVFRSAMVAERLIDYGAILADHPDAVHPAVRAAIEPGLGYSARDAFEALYTLKAMQRRAAQALAGIDALVVPTIPTIFTIAQMLAEPMARNDIMGTYTYFVNPLDLCAVSVPGQPRADGLPSAVCFVGLPGRDHDLGVLASLFESALGGI